MARSRMVKPTFFTDWDLYDAEHRSGLPLRVAYQSLWCQADREGRFEWKPRELKLDCLPYDDCDFESVLDSLVNFGFVARYEVDGRSYGWIPNLKRHQHFHKAEAQSTIPAPPEHRTSTGQAPGADGANPPCSDTSSDTCLPSADAAGESGAADDWLRWFLLSWERHVGVPNRLRIAEAVTPLVHQHGLDQVWCAWDGYAREAGKQGAKVRFFPPHKFTETYAAQVQAWAWRTDEAGRETPVPSQPGVLTFPPGCEPVLPARRARVVAS